MKNLFHVCSAIGFIFVLTTSTTYAQDACTTIQDGTLISSTGDTITTGYDEWGYNYQAHMFHGMYCEFDGNRNDCATNTDELIMKWNDAWLSNKDCDGDSYLDRHFGFASYKGSGAWLTNHQSGYVQLDNGKWKKWLYFVKIVAVPMDAQFINGYWYTADGTEIGYAIWNDFAVVEEIYNDPSAGVHGILYKSPTSCGLAQFGPQ